MAVFLVLVSACHQDMYNQPKHRKALMQSDFFADGMVARPQVPGTVSQSQALYDEHLSTGKVNGEFVTTFPYTITRSVLRQGQAAFNIYCVPCHGTLGNGRGMVQRRGLTTPANYHTDRLRGVSPGYIFDVITNGYRNMYPYGSRISLEDRWAIVAYVRALQWSQYATCDDVPDDEAFKQECEAGGSESGDDEDEEDAEESENEE
ncbi:MAG: cytochrome c [Chloroflexaceae bacterium]|nr:cytochrome c [Chloroflexaceae bacterium]